MFADAAHQLSFLVFLLNPKDPRHYAKAVGWRGKTDRVDAELSSVASERRLVHRVPSPRRRVVPFALGEHGPEESSGPEKSTS